MTSSLVSYNGLQLLSVMYFLLFVSLLLLCSEFLGLSLLLLLNYVRLGTPGALLPTQPYSALFYYNGCYNNICLCLTLLC